MKTRLLTLAVVGTLLAGCEHDNDNIRVDRAIDDAFRSRYPNVTRVEWESKNGYYVADFWRNNTESEAWYDRNGVWYMTETDVRYADLPQAVRAAFEQGEYAAWRIEDVDMLEYPDRETVYIIETEQGNAECDLWFTPDGVLVKAVPENSGDNGGDNSGGTHQPSTVLPAIEAFIAERYPQARIIDVETERNAIEVDIVDGLTPREVMFSLTGEWTYTETDVRYVDLPQAVRAAFEQGEYAAWHVDDIDMMEYPNRETVYIIETERGNVERDLWFTPDGVLAKTVPEGSGNATDDNNTGDNNGDNNNGDGNNNNNSNNNNGNSGNNNGGTQQPSTVLSAIEAFIAGKYPQARIVDVETERTEIEVDIVDGRTPREVVFSPAGEWTYTETEVRKADVPATVLNALAASQYASWHVDDVDHYATPTGEYYLFELESRHSEVNLKIGVNGDLL